MKLSVIGYWGAYPEKNSATSAYLLEEEGFKLLIDCGSGSLAQLQNYMELPELDALILSHYHHDHVADVGSLQYALLIHTLLGKREGVFPIYGHDQDQDKFAALTYREVTEGRPIQAGKPFSIGPWQVTFCPTVHPAYCLAMRFESTVSNKRLVYSADTTWSDSLVSFARGAQLLLCEASFYDEEEHARHSGHMTATMAGRLAQEAEVSRLLLTHLPHFGNQQELVKYAESQYNGPIMLAEGGLVIEI